MRPRIVLTSIFLLTLSFVMATCLTSASAQTKSTKSSVRISNVLYRLPVQLSARRSHSTPKQYPIAAIGAQAALWAELNREQIAGQVNAYLTTQRQIENQREAAASAAQQAAARAASSTPAVHTSPTATTPSAPSGGSGWSQVAVCEEGGSNNYTYGYFGILPSSWAAAGGTAYSATAGGSSWDVQVMIGDRINGGGPPWAPAGCGNAGYHGW